MATSSAALAARARAVSANNVVIAFPQDAQPSQPPPREQRPRQQPLPLGPPPPLTRSACVTDASVAASVPRPRHRHIAGCVCAVRGGPESGGIVVERTAVKRIAVERAAVEHAAAERAAAERAAAERAAAELATTAQ